MVCIATSTRIDVAPNSKCVEMKLEVTEIPLSRRNVSSFCRTSPSCTVTGSAMKWRFLTRWPKHNQHLYVISLTSQRFLRHSTMLNTSWPSRLRASCMWMYTCLKKLYNPTWNCTNYAEWDNALDLRERCWSRLQMKILMHRSWRFEANSSEKQAGNLKASWMKNDLYDV